MYWMQCLFDAWEWPICILQTKKNHTKELESLATLKAELGIDEEMLEQFVLDVQTWAKDTGV